MDFIDIDETLLLRTVYENDICNTWVEALNNKNHMKWSRQRHLTHSIVSIRNYIDELKEEGGSILGIFQKNSKLTLVGTITLRTTANYIILGFLVFPEFAGRGLLKKSLARLLDKAIQDYKINGFYIGTHKDNIPMQMVAETSHFVRCDFEKLPEEISLLIENNRLHFHYLKKI